MSGYCSMARFVIATPPSKSVMTANDMANIGRLIKKLFIAIVYLCVILTFTPSRSFCNPVVATTSPAATPSSTIHDVP